MKKYIILSFILMIPFLSVAMDMATGHESETAELVNELKKEECDFEIVDTLLQQEPNKSIMSDIPFLKRNGCLNNAFLWAAMEGDCTFCESVLAEKTEEPLDYDTALYFAATNTHKKICDLLIEHGANLRLAEIDLAELLNTKAHIKFVQYLILNGADVNIKTIGNLTPLMVAANKRYFDVCSLLLDKGAQFHETTDDILAGWTAMNYAAQEPHHHETCTLLLKYMMLFDTHKKCSVQEARTRLKSILLTFNRMNNDQRFSDVIPKELIWVIILSNQELFEDVCILALHDNFSIDFYPAPLFLAIAEKIYQFLTDTGKAPLLEMKSRAHKDAQTLFDPQNIISLFNGRLRAKMEKLFASGKNLKTLMK